MAAWQYAGRWGPEALLDALGRPQPYATVTVHPAGQATAATVYADKTRGVLANPLPTGVPDGAPGVDVDGNAMFYADPGDYDLTFTIGGRTRLLSVTIDPHPSEPAIAGPPGPPGRSLNPRGTWASNVDYATLDVVNSGGVTYVARVDVPHGTVAPVDGATWMRLYMVAGGGSGGGGALPDVSGASDGAVLTFTGGVLAWRMADVVGL